MTGTGQRAGSWGAAACALLVALCVPFLGRAHGIDDPLYLQAARRVLDAPLDPWRGASFWHERPTTLFHDFYNPPLTAYLLALPVALDGGSELAVHVLMLALACLALLACARTGRALGVDQRWTLLLAASPALACATLSAMTDVPFLLFSSATWAAALRGREALAGISAGLSAVTRYAGLLNLPLLALAAPRRDRRSVRGVLLALTLFAGGSAWSLWQAGALHLLEAGRFQRFALEHQGRIAFAFVAALGLTGLPAALGLLRWTLAQAGVSILAGLLGLAVLHAETWSPVNAWLGLVALSSGAALIWAALDASFRRSAGLFAVAAFWTFAAQAVLLVYFGAARYALPALPPLLWLLVRAGRLPLDASPRRFRLALGAASVLTLTVLWADAGYANAWREAALRLPAARRGFLVGHWGFQHYGEMRGYRPLEPRQELRSGDVVAEARGIHGQPFSPAHAALLSAAERVRVPSPAVRVMDRAVGAGLYSDAWGPLPFAVRPRAFEEVAVRRVVPWIQPLLEEPLAGGVVLDMGAPETSHVCLDGWSGIESFVEGSTRRTFIWAEGSESALRLLLPPGVRQLRLVASPDAAAVGSLSVTIGSNASALVELQPGWHGYAVPVIGNVEGGVTTVVLRAVGYRRSGPFDHERRALSVAVDSIGFGEADPAVSRGVWPVRASADEPGLLVARASRRLSAQPAGRLRGRLRVLAGSADISAGALLWSTRGIADCDSAGGCAFEVSLPAAAEPAVLRADAAILTAFSAEPEQPRRQVRGSRPPG